MVGLLAFQTPLAALIESDKVIEDGVPLLVAPSTVHMKHIKLNSYTCMFVKYYAYLFNELKNLPSCISRFCMVTTKCFQNR